MLILPARHHRRQCFSIVFVVLFVVISLLVVLLIIIIPGSCIFQCEMPLLRVPFQPTRCVGCFREEKSLLVSEWEVFNDRPVSLGSPYFRCSESSLKQSTVSEHLPGLTWNQLRDASSSEHLIHQHLPAVRPSGCVGHVEMSLFSFVEHSKSLTRCSMIPAWQLLQSIGCQKTSRN